MSYSCGNEYCCSSTNYNLSTEPGYTARFYSASSQEQFSDIRYSKTTIDYDSSLDHIKEIVQGPPLEAYIPQSHGSDGPISAAAPKPIEIIEPKKSIEEEIDLARRAVIRRIVRKRRFTLKYRRKTVKLLVR